MGQDRPSRSDGDRTASMDRDRTAPTNGDRRAVAGRNLFDTADPRRIMNEFLLGIFVPAALVFVTAWAVFRLYLDGWLSALGLVRVTPHPLPFIAIESGYGRAVLLILLTSVVVLAYLVLYVRVLRGPLRERGIV